MLVERAHDDVRPMLVQDYGDQLVRVKFILYLLRAHPDFVQTKEAVEQGKFNVIVTTQLPIVLTLRAPAFIMYVIPTTVVRILNLYRFDELPCHLTQALCREATTDHLVRMVERGRLHDTKFLQPTPDAAGQEWIESVTRLDGAIPPSSIYIRPSTESPSPSTHRRLRDTTTANRLSPSDALIVIHLILQERSKSGIGVPGQSTVHFSRRDKAPRDACQVSIPGFEDCNKIEEYGHSRLEALVAICLSACQLLQTRGLLEPAHFPAIYPFVSVPRTIEPQQSKKAKSNGVRTHPRRTPLFWSLSTETPEGLWYPTIVFIDGSAGVFGLLAILTRHPLPTISDLPLFISGNPVNVRLRKCQPGHFSPDEVEQLRRTTLRIMRFVGNKPFVSDLNRLPYMLFPLEPDASLLRSLHEPYWAHKGYSRLDSPLVSRTVMNMAASAFLPIVTDRTEDIIKDLNDAVIQDRKIEYTKHYFVDKIREDLTPLHEPQEGEVSVS
jgi:endoribonuclease Dicer